MYNVFLDVAVDCGPLHNPSNGTVELDQGTLFKANVSYACNNGYNLANGSINRTCLSTGNWSGSEPQCNGTNSHNKKISNMKN